MLSKTLAAVRSLGARNVRTIVSEKIRFHTSGFSRYADHTLVNPDPKESPEQFYSWLCDTVKREDCNVLFPMDDDTMEIAVKHQQELRAFCHVPVPPLASYQIAADKRQTMQYAKKAGVPCPQTVETNFDSEYDQDELVRISSELEYPLVIKPRFSSGSRGVRFAYNQDQLLALFPIIHKQYPNPLLQEYIPPGTKYDVGVCYDANHMLKAAFVQRQIRNYPIQRGPSTVHESVNHQKLIDYAAQLMAHLPWYGVADIEFIIDPRNGEPKLLEINPRFWSSLHLSIRCGVDFPWILYQLAMGHEVESILEYRSGILGRALLPGDILHYASNPDRKNMNPPFWTLGIPDDTLSKNDPMPAVGFFFSALRYSFDIDFWKFLIHR
ncbi:ATP-grasp domain-containing protein [Fodinisporobacter ferrooxydans]|uniref:ATP-grasp domain-containing protein n=1 Tax=Fodinisporobacter ferrooxydans TaxID=2901836 RepID=A0ABY4CNF1_9BACL|nr:ATP-grasp domain-containing protein [Alicyclobacillaceae bacterium MYW30-H2]